MNSTVIAPQEIINALAQEPNLWNALGPRVELMLKRELQAEMTLENPTHRWIGSRRIRFDASDAVFRSMELSADSIVLWLRASPIAYWDFGRVISCWGSRRWSWRSFRRVDAPGKFIVEWKTANRGIMEIVIDESGTPKVMLPWAEMPKFPVLPSVLEVS